jgi:glycerol-3-phosphate acyltransferase PlsY
MSVPITLIVVVAAFISGALPLAVWVGRLALRTDIRRYGDGNPGTFNVFRAGGTSWGLLALTLEILKGLLPVAIARYVLNFEGLALLLVALAPIYGHAFSPFLRGRGGKAVAVTFAIWAGLTIWEVPTVLGLLLGFWYAFVRQSGWAVILAMISLLFYLLLTQPDPLLLGVWSGNFLIFAWKHRSELTELPTLKDWYLALDLPWRSQS